MQCNLMQWQGHQTTGNQYIAMTSGIGLQSIQICAGMRKLTFGDSAHFDVCTRARSGEIAEICGD